MDGVRQSKAARLTTGPPPGRASYTHKKEAREATAHSRLLLDEKREKGTYSRRARPLFLAGFQLATR